MANLPLIARIFVPDYRISLKPDISHDTRSMRAAPRGRAKFECVVF